MEPIVLASASPRRRELFALLELPFVVQSEFVDETPRPDESPDLLVARLSGVKAAAVRDLLIAEGELQAERLVLAADTVVVLNGEILGKPRNSAEAVDMLTRLRNRSHTVHSGVAVVEAISGRAVVQLDSTTVWMRDYGDSELEEYVRSGDPMDKAGAYAIQHTGFHPVDRIDGCFASVMGLPLKLLVRALIHFGVTPPVDVAAVCRERIGQSCCLD